jgi:hypothetical protein
VGAELTWVNCSPTHLSDKPHPLERCQEEQRTGHPLTGLGPGEGQWVEGAPHTSITVMSVCCQDFPAGTRNGLFFSVHSVQLPTQQPELSHREEPAPLLWKHR